MSNWPWSNKPLKTTQELLDLDDGQRRKDMIVMAFEEAIQGKLAREGRESLNTAEMTVLAVEALEREVNNGGYSQFFLNSSAEFAPILVDSLERIDCPKAAAVAQSAIDALELPDLNVEAIQTAIRIENREREAKLATCDDAFFAYEEDITGGLLAFIRANRDLIRIP